MADKESKTRDAIGHFEKHLRKHGMTEKQAYDKARQIARQTDRNKAGQKKK